MDREGNFYASNEHAAGSFNHATLARGQNVAFAGEIEVKDGVLTFISNQSGHYLPGTAYTLQAIESLRHQGAKFAEDYRLESYEHATRDGDTETPLSLLAPY